MAATQSNRSFFRRKSGLFLLALVVAMAVIGILELTNTTYIFHKKKVPATIPASVQKKKTEVAQKVSSQPSSSQDNKGKSALPPGSGSGASLTPPLGNFVSNHFPGQNGTSTKEQSVCNTTPGAACYIQFTNTGNGKTTRLAEQTVGQQGFVLWDWDANTLTAGTWEIKAVASLNGQAQSATDSIKLEVR